MTIVLRPGTLRLHGAAMSPCDSSPTVSEVPVVRLPVTLASLTLALAGFAGGSPLSAPEQAPPPIARVASSTTTWTATDQEYLDRLTEAGVPVDDPAGIIEDGYGVCLVLDTHSSRGELVIAQMAMQKDHGLTEDEAKIMVDTAVRVYCPNHGDALG
jgi:hypothetical protein